MKRLSIIIVTLFAIVTCGFTASMLWNVVPEGTTVSFELSEGTKGTLSGLRGSIEFDKNDLTSSKFVASVNVSSLNTGNDKKDQHLLSADFFNAEKFPFISFASSSVKATKDGFVATGNLTMKETTKAIEIPFTFTEDANGGGIFKGTMTVHSGDFGVTKPSTDGKDEVIVTLNIPVKK